MSAVSTTVRHSSNGTGAAEPAPHEAPTALSGFVNAAGVRIPLPAAALRAEDRQVVAQIGTPLASTRAAGRFALTASKSLHEEQQDESERRSSSKSAAARQAPVHNGSCQNVDLQPASSHLEGDAQPEQVNGAAGLRRADQDAESTCQDDAAQPALGRRQGEGHSSLPVPPGGKTDSQANEDGLPGLEDSTASSQAHRRTANTATSQPGNVKREYAASGMHALHMERNGDEDQRQCACAPGLQSPMQSSNLQAAMSPSLSSPYGCTSRPEPLRQRSKQASSCGSSLWWDEQQ